MLLLWCCIYFCFFCVFKNDTTQSLEEADSWFAQKGMWQIWKMWWEEGGSIWEKYTRMKIRKIIDIIFHCFFLFVCFIYIYFELKTTFNYFMYKVYLFVILLFLLFNKLLHPTQTYFVKYWFRIVVPWHTYLSKLVLS